MDRFNGKDAVIPISGNFGWKLDKNTGRTIFIRIVKSTKKCVNLAAEHNRIANFSKHFINHERELHLFYEYPMNLGNATRILNNFYKDGLPELAIRLIARNLLEALSHLHSQGIIHRAVCAENIFLNSDGHCRLALTEHAIKIEECPRWMGQQDRVHNFNNLEDVFVWLAPEVLRQDLNGYGTQADVYSFGICLCELANGVAPFSEMEPLQILYEKLRGTTPFLQQEGYSSPGIHNQRCFSQQLHQIVNDSLEIEPLQRPSARQLLDKYGDFLCANSTTFHFGPDELLRTMPMANKLF